MRKMLSQSKSYLLGFKFVHQSSESIQTPIQSISELPHALCSCIQSQHSWAENSVGQTSWIFSKHLADLLLENSALQKSVPPTFVTSLIENTKWDMFTCPFRWPPNYFKDALLDLVIYSSMMCKKQLLVSL